MACNGVNPEIQDLSCPTLLLDIHHLEVGESRKQLVISHQETSLTYEERTTLSVINEYDKYTVFKIIGSTLIKNPGFI